MQTVKEGKFFKSNIDNEAMVLGKFARVKTLNAAKSKAAGRRMYNEITVLFIKIDSPVSRDSVVHEILPADNKSQKLKERFKDAWNDFVKVCPDAQKAE